MRTSGEELRSGRHIQALDGLRALAVAAVILYHARVTLAGGGIVRGYEVAALAGWVGVDLFFVLSGFLITGILLDSKGGDHYFRNFYVRRTLRIFPLYYGVLIVVLVILPRFLDTSDPGQQTILHEQGWLWTYTTNLEVWRWGGKLFTSGWMSLTHFWSLAIEEQFYLVWPLLVWLLSRRGLTIAAVAIVIAAPILRAAMLAGGVSPAIVYEVTPCRLDPLALGALAAVLVRARPEWVGRASLGMAAAGALGVLAVAAIEHGFDAEAYGVQTIGLSALALGFGGAVLRAADGARWLEHRALTTIGKYSYGIYVFHALLLPVYKRILTPTTLAGAIAYLALVFGASVAIAAVSWHVYERRFLALKDRWAPTSARGRAEAVPAARVA